MRQSKEKGFLDSEIGEEYLGSKKPSLKPESLDGADSAVLTVKDVEGVDVPDDEMEDGVRKSVRIDFEDTDLPYWPNKTGLRTLAEKFGAKPGSWIGEKVALIVVRVNNPKSGKQQPAQHVAQGDEFDELVKKSSKPRRRTAKVSAKRAAKKK